MKYAFICKQSTDYPVTVLCRVMGVNCSPYYDWKGRKTNIIPPEEMALRRRMKALFAASRDSLGSRTLMENLQAEGFVIGRDKAHRLMKALNLKIKQKRKYKITTDSKHRLPVAQNILNRQFSSQAPYQAWSTDITYL